MREEDPMRAAMCAGLPVVMDGGQPGMCSQQPLPLGVTHPMDPDYI